MDTHVSILFHVIKSVAEMTIRRVCIASTSTTPLPMPRTKAPRKEDRLMVEKCDRKRKTPRQVKIVPDR